MYCPGCQKKAKAKYRCEHCDYGLERRPEPPRRSRPAFLGDQGGQENPYEFLARNFKCQDCGSFGAEIIPMQDSDLVAFACRFCGKATLYSTAILEAQFERNGPLLKTKQTSD